ncbi:MAG: peptidoglycan-binding protein [Anaerolineae bacterium]|nr:peptidoglycan-binding protein [Anaerolineae bacterium]
MATTLSASVGRGGENRLYDVVIVQALLNGVPSDQGGPSAQLGVDGLIGPGTIGAIETFQSANSPVVDGRVDPGGNTLAKLNELSRADLAATVVLRFGPNARQDTVSDYTRGVLLEILKASGLHIALISSSARTVDDQVRIMYSNLETHGVAHQKDLYGVNGDNVIDTYDQAKKAGKSESEIKAAMKAKIEELGPRNVSKHLVDPNRLNVVDIAPSSIADRPAFEGQVEKAKEDTRVSRFITPAQGDPAYHIEIPQPQS